MMLVKADMYMTAYQYTKGKKMKSQLQIEKKMIALVLAGSFIAGCATDSENKNTYKGAGIGAAVGAGLGAIIGHQSGRRNEGALIGAALGGLVGGSMGRRLDQQQKELEKVAETKRTEQGLITKLKSDILFDTGKADLKPSAKNNLSQLAAILKKYPENIYTIKGYTDDTGSQSVNLPLSENRARSVQSYLVAQGVSSGTMSSVGLGSENPVSTGKTAAARSQNRRVEIEITVDESKIPQQN
jgi:outer membrane protein OmpA-like peptidoglycan-associated protein